MISCTTDATENRGPMTPIYDDNDRMIKSRYHYDFLHNVFGHFYNDTMEYFSTYLEEAGRKFDYKVIGTYDKAVEWLNKNAQYGREIDMAMKPALILNPSGDFAFDEAISGAVQLWRFPNLAPAFIKRLYEPIYQDTNLIVTPGFSRIKGEIEFLALINSFYEYVDLKMYLLLIFGGMGRPIYPRFFNSFIILPQALIDYEYEFEDGTKYKIDWVTNGAYDQLIRTIDKRRLVYPCQIRPRYKLTAMTDASSRLGGIEGLPDWRLAWSIEYEVEIPTFMLLDSDYLAENIHFEFRYGSCYSANNLTDTPPVNKMIFDTHWDVFNDTTSALGINISDERKTPTELEASEAEIIYKAEAVFKTRYYCPISSVEEQSSSFDIIVNEILPNRYFINMFGPKGELEYGDDFEIVSSNDGTSVIAINNIELKLKDEDFLELYVYEQIGSSSGSPI